MNRTAKVRMTRKYFVLCVTPRGRTDWNGPPFLAYYFSFYFEVRVRRHEGRIHFDLMDRIGERKISCIFVCKSWNLSARKSRERGGNRKVSDIGFLIESNLVSSDSTELKSRVKNISSWVISSEFSAPKGENSKQSKLASAWLIVRISVNFSSLLRIFTAPESSELSFYPEPNRESRSARDFKSERGENGGFFTLGNSND